MNPPRIHLHAVCLAILFGLAFASVRAAGATVTTNIFSTRFEAAEGYSTNLDLAGQNGWFSFGSGGNGVVTNYIEGEGQQAYIGSFPPDEGDDQLSLGRPIDLSPIPTNMPIVQFSVLMSIVDSSNTNYDDFYWSVYNTQDHRLLTLDFDNFNTNISYVLEGTTNFVSTGQSFAPDTVYTLVITMNFPQNSWSATLDGVLLTTNQPITTTGSVRDIADVDAEWIVFDPENPGDNFMLFDNYQLTAEVLLPPAPLLQILNRTGDGQVPLRVLGQSGTRFAIDATTNLTQWTALKTNVVTDGSFDYIDSSASAFARRFYRARWVQ